MNLQTELTKAIFLSDVHLGGFDESTNRQLERELIHLIEYCKQNEIVIYVLGDLFDYWMEYPNYVPDLAKNVRQKFKEYNEQFGPTLFITGNHDNWTRDYLPAIGFDTEKNMRTQKMGGRTICLLHGDGLDDAGMDLPRPLMHRLLRHPSFIRFYQTLFPPRVGLKLMKKFSLFTRSDAEEVTEQKKLNKWAENQLKEKDIDIIICGHDHIPRIKKFDFGTYINLGTFCTHRTLAMYNNRDFSLVQWREESQKLKPYSLQP